MAEPFIGQVEIFGFDFPPKFWATCAGQLLSIQQNAALFSLLGTTYGGNGTNTFALPDLRSRVPLSQGQGPGLPNFVIGQAGGEDAHTVIAAETPQHSHFLNADATTTNGLVEIPAAGLALGLSTGKPPTGSNFTLNIFNTAAPSGTILNAGTVSNAGGSQAHDNHMPYLAVNFCIALNGIFPSRN